MIIAVLTTFVLRVSARFLWWKMSFERLLEPRRMWTNPLLLDQLSR